MVIIKELMLLDISYHCYFCSVLHMEIIIMLLWALEEHNGGNAEKPLVNLTKKVTYEELINIPVQFWT